MPGPEDDSYQHRNCDTGDRLRQPIADGKSLLTSFDLKFVTAVYMMLAGEG